MFSLKITSYVEKRNALERIEHRNGLHWMPDEELIDLARHKHGDDFVAAYLKKYPSVIYRLEHFYLTYLLRCKFSDETVQNKNNYKEIYESIEKLLKRIENFVPILQRESHSQKKADQ